MIPDNPNSIPRPRSGPIKWLTNTVRGPLEQTISEHLGHTWRIKSETDMSEFACHRSAIVSDGSCAVFFKFAVEPDAPRQFEIELSGLRFLAEKAGALIPQPVGIVPVETGALLVMEALESIERGPHQWRQIGAALGRTHRVRGERFGLERSGFWGPLPQDNTLSHDWVGFFRDRRLLPMLRVAADSGHLPVSVATQVESVLPRLPELCGPEVTPSLLHGDAQQNNFISTAVGAYVIDPAIYFGHPEADLALLDAFQPVPEDVFEGYREEMPTDPGFPERRNLWRVPLYLAAVALEGPMHLGRLTGAVRRYV